MIGILGAGRVTPRTTSANGASTGSTSGEWNAWPTRSRVVFANPEAMASTSASGPDTTSERGPLTAAIAVFAVSRTSSSRASIATIAPPSGRSRISRPRAVTSFAASGSDSTPATQAAESSPREWPTSASGK